MSELSLRDRRFVFGFAMIVSGLALMAIYRLVILDWVSRPPAEKPPWQVEQELAERARVEGEARFRDGYRRIAAPMTLDEVRLLLGAPGQPVNESDLRFSFNRPSRKNDLRLWWDWYRDHWPGLASTPCVWLWQHGVMRLFVAFRSFPEATCDRPDGSVLRMGMKALDTDPGPCETIIDPGLEQYAREIGAGDRNDDEKPLDVLDLANAYAKDAAAADARYRNHWLFVGGELRDIVQESDGRFTLILIPGEKREFPAGVTEIRCRLGTVWPYFSAWPGQKVRVLASCVGKCGEAVVLSHASVQSASGPPEVRHLTAYDLLHWKEQNLTGLKAFVSGRVLSIRDGSVETRTANQLVLSSPYGSPRRIVVKFDPRWASHFSVESYAPGSKNASLIGICTAVTESEIHIEQARPLNNN